MNKLFTKIAVVTAGFAMAIGVGAVALSRNAFAESRAAKGDLVSDSALDLSKGADSKDDLDNLDIEWSMAGGKIRVKQLRSSAGSANTGEATFSAVNKSYISAPRMYRGHTLAFESIDEFMIKDVKITYTGSYTGHGPIVGDVYGSQSMTVYSSNTHKSVTGARGVTSDTTNYTLDHNSSSKVYTITVNKTGGTNVLYLQNYDQNNSTTSTQLRFTAVTVSYIVGNEAKAADEVVVSGSSAMVAGEKVVFSAVAKNSGSAEGVDQTVEWSVSDTSVLSVDSLGNVTALNNGTANVIATTANSISGSLSVTVSGAATTGAPQTVCPNFYELTSGAYAANDGFHTYRGFVTETKDVCVQQSDADTVYKKGGFMIRKTDGLSYLRTKTNVGSKISKVIISGVSTTAPGLTVKGSDTMDGVTTSSQDVSSSGRIHSYVFATPVTYVTIASDNTETTTINSITFEFVGGAETVDSLADYILGLTPDRSDVTGLCDGANGNYEVAKARYVAASAAVKSSFQTSEDATVAKARARYEQWAGVYGDATPFADTMSLSARLSDVVNNNSSLAMIIVAIISTLTLAGASTLLVLKRRKHN